MAHTSTATSNRAKSKGSVGRRARTAIMAEVLALLLILTAGAGLRAAYFPEAAQGPNMDLPGTDAQFTAYWMHGLLSGDWTPASGMADPKIQSAPFFRPPGYAYAVAGLHRLTGGVAGSIPIAQMAIGLFNALLLFLLIRPLFGRGSALFGAAFMVVYWAFIPDEARFNASVFTIFFLLLLLHFLRRWPERAGAPSLFIAGGLLGALCLFQPGFILFAPVVLIWCGIVARGRKAPKRVLLAGLLFLCGIALATAPAAVRNYRVSGEFVPISTGAGIDLYAGNNPASEGIWAKINLQETLGIDRAYAVNETPLYLDALKKKTGQEGLTYSGMSRYFARQALEYMAQNPLHTLKACAKRAVLLCGPVDMANNSALYYDKPNSRVLRYLPGFPAVMTLFLMGLLFLCLRLRAERASSEGFSSASRLSILILLLALSAFVICLPFPAAICSRIGITPLLLFFGACAAARIVAFLQEGRFLPVMFSLAACAVLFSAADLRLVPIPQAESRWHFSRGLAFENAPAPEKALEEYRQCVESGDVPMGHRNYGNALAHAARYEEAAQQYAEEHRLFPETPFVDNNWGQVLLMLGKSSEAIAHLNEALRQKPGVFELMGMLGDALTDAGQTEEAQKQYSQMLHSDPKFKWNTRVQLLGGNSQDEEEHLAATMRRYSAYADAHMAYGKEMGLKGAIEDALYHFREAVRIYPQSSQAHSGLAVLLQTTGNVEEAREELKTAFSLNPEDMQVECARATILSNQGKFNESIQLLREALTQHPGNTELLNALAFQLAQTNKKEEALEVFTEALKQDPKNKLAHNNLGNLLTDLGRYDEALPHFEEIVKLDPDDNFAEFNWGRTLALKGAGKEAVSHFRESVRRHPEFVAAHNFLGYELAKLGQNEEAVKEYEAALKLDPDFILARNNLGTLLLDQGKLDDAALQFQEALRINPNDPFPAEHLKTIEEKRGEAPK